MVVWLTFYLHLILCTLEMILRTHFVHVYYETLKLVCFSGK